MADLGKSGSSVQPENPSGADAFQIAGWTIHPTTNRMSSGSETVRLEPKVMQVLAYLAQRSGQTVTRDELARVVWAGTVVGDDAVTNAIIKLRKAFDDDSRSSKVIETIPKRGYRLLAKVERLRGGENRAPEETPVIDTTANGTQPQAAPPTIAVLPFRNLSDDSEQEYFSDGITEDITTALSNTGWFFVTARHSAFAYKGTAIDVRQVGKELGVQYVLEGSVRKGGDKIRVTAQLIETATGKHIWANRYDGMLRDIFDLQDQITETIVATLEPEFHRAEAERVAQKRPDSMEAYDYLLRGVAYMNKLTPEDTKMALQYFYKAIEKDPNYGRAYAYVFWCYRREVESRGMVLSKQEQAEVIRLMEAGLKADKTDPIVVWQAGSMKVYFQHDFEGALALIERSLSIDPNSTRALIASSMTHSFMGNTDTAIKHAERAIRISPRSPAHWMAYTCLAQSHLQELRYEEAAKAAKKAIQLNPNLIPAYLILAASCAHLGQLDEAQVAIQEALKLNPKLTVARFPELFPISKLKNLDAYLTGLRKAGLPD
jgi:TolB-like protein/Flp pilus assembly protein TadD